MGLILDSEQRPVPTRLVGRYFPDGKSASDQAFLEDRGTGLGVIDARTGHEKIVEFSHLSDRLGTLPRKIYMRDGSVFECADNDAVDLAFGQKKHAFSILAKAENSWKIAFISVFAVFLAIFAIYRWGLPAAAYVAAKATPSNLVDYMDASTLASVDRVLFVPSQLDEKKKTQVRRLFEEVSAAANLKPEEVYLQFRGGGRIGANAFALPGGTVILTDELIEIATNDDQIAGVVAHEIGHYTETHSLRQLYRALGVAFMITVVAGDVGVVLDQVVSQLALLDTLRYSRDYEREADAVSVELMLKMNRDPVAFIDLLDLIVRNHRKSDDDKTSILDTHPSNDNRREEVENLIERLK